MSDDLPTTPLPKSDDSASQPGGSGGRRALIIILSIIAGLLLIAFTVVLTLLLLGQGAQNDPVVEPSTSVSVSPSASPSLEPSAEPGAEPSAEPSEEPEETSAPPAPPPPPPPATGPVFTSFSPANNSSVGCPDDSSQVPLTFTWASTGATEAAIGVGTTDAFAGAYETGLPPSGSYTNLNYQCSNASQTYTVSIRGTSGQTNKTITLKR